MPGNGDQRIAEPKLAGSGRSNHQVFLAVQHFLGVGEPGKVEPLALGRISGARLVSNVQRQLSRAIGTDDPCQDSLPRGWAEKERQQFVTVDTNLWKKLLKINQQLTLEYSYQTMQTVS